MARMNLDLVLKEPTGTSLAALFPVASQDKHLAIRELIAILSALVGGTIRGRMRLAIDDSTGVAASQTVTCDQSDGVAGDRLLLGGHTLTAVASGAVSADGQYSLETGNDEVATSLAAAINAYPPTRDLFVATVATNVVTITAREKGDVGNNVTLIKSVTTANALVLGGATLAGGRDGGQRQTVLGTFSGVGTANDTISIGGVTLTLKAAAGNENEITIGGTAAETATNTIAKINAHTKLKGLVLASSGGSAIVSLVLLVGGRIGELVTLTESGTGFSWAAGSFAPTTTEAWAAGGQSYDFGVPT